MCKSTWQILEALPWFYVICGWCVIWPSLICSTRWTLVTAPACPASQHLGQAFLSLAEHDAFSHIWQASEWSSVVWSRSEHWSILWVCMVTLHWSILWYMVMVTHGHTMDTNTWDAPHLSLFNVASIGHAIRYNQNMMEYYTCTNHFVQWLL